MDVDVLHKLQLGELIRALVGGGSLELDRRRPSATRRLKIAVVVVRRDVEGSVVAAMVRRGGFDGAAHHLGALDALDGAIDLRLAHVLHRSRLAADEALQLLALLTKVGRRAMRPLLLRTIGCAQLTT